MKCRDCKHYRNNPQLGTYCLNKLLADTKSTREPEDESCEEFAEKDDWRPGDKLSGKGEVE